MELSLYRARRPEVFEEIIGQKHIVKILQNQLRTGTVSQAYLFSGIRGTGKTTTARILAKAVNCLTGEPGIYNENEPNDPANYIPCGHCKNCLSIKEGKFVDVIELDAASNNGVDDLRSIIEMVKYPPTIGRYKVYIIDEVHMLSQVAENAFLKTLEEPPEYAIFILATTDPEKVRPTIRSRCMQLHFKRVSNDDIIGGMKKICKSKDIMISDEALEIVSLQADGSVRDALSILDQLIATGDKKIDADQVLEYTGSVGLNSLIELTSFASESDLSGVFNTIDRFVRSGKDEKQLIKDWLQHYRNLMVCKYVSNPAKVIGLADESIELIKEQEEQISIDDISMAIKILSNCVNESRYSERPRILLESAAINIALKSDEKKNINKAYGERTDRQALRTELKKNTEKNNIDIKNSNLKGDKISEKNKDINKDKNIYELPYTEESITEIADEKKDKENPNRENSNKKIPEKESSDKEIRKSNDVSADKMWIQIVDDVSQKDKLFKSFIGRNSSGIKFEKDELIVAVIPTKMSMIQRWEKDIKASAMKILGSGVSVKFKDADSITDSDTDNEGISNQTADNDDVTLVQNLEKLFQTKVTIED